ncbi:hypothetical protein LXL04_003135 [Taraxacum kok-saghyz]
MAGLLGCRRGWFFLLVGHRRDHHLADDFFSSPSWCDNLQATTAITSKAAMTEPEPIDLEYYRKGLRSHIVDSYKDYYDNKTTPEYKPKFDALMVELKEAEQKSLKESERLEKEIADVQDLKKKLSTMTADEYFEKHPELKKKFDDEIRNDYWGT